MYICYHLMIWLIHSLLSMKAGNGTGKTLVLIVIVKIAEPRAGDDTTHNNNIGCGTYRSYWPGDRRIWREGKNTNITPTPVTIQHYMFFVHSVGGGGNFGFRNKILCIPRYTASILYTFLELHVCNIDQIVLCSHVSHTADEILHGVNVYIYTVKIFHSGVILYDYCRIDEDRNIVYSRTHIQIVNQHDTIYYALYILYTTLTAMYEQKHCRFTNTNFQSSLITQPMYTTMIIIFLNGFVDRVLHFKHWTHVYKNPCFQ